KLVTGVQTCALPILLVERPDRGSNHIFRGGILARSHPFVDEFRNLRVKRKIHRHHSVMSCSASGAMVSSAAMMAGEPPLDLPSKIGRASCRERVEI